MATEIRPVSEDELDRFHFLVSYSFASDRSQEARERMKHVESMGKDFALYEDGQMAACLRILSLRVFVHGASVPVGGVSHVACLPEHRRRGFAGQLLRHALATMRDDGQPLSSLFTPHPSLYRRYGWIVAASVARYSFKPKDVAPLDRARPEGSAYRISEEEWPTIAEVYKRYAAPRIGYLDRDERWWQEAVLRRVYDEQRRLHDVAVWADGRGEPQGYLVYHTARERRAADPPIDKFVIEEFVALSGEAYRGLLRYVLAHDLAADITWWGPTEEPLIAAVDEPALINDERHHGYMLRIVDVEKALAARPPAAAAVEGAFTVHVADPSAPWNQGVWRIECADSRLAATRADGTAHLSTDAAAFAAMYNGFLRPSEAVRSGLAETSDSRAAALADRILAVDYPPFPGDFF